MPCHFARGQQRPSGMARNPGGGGAGGGAGGRHGCLLLTAARSQQCGACMSRVTKARAASPALTFGAQACAVCDRAHANKHVAAFKVAVQAQQRRAQVAPAEVAGRAGGHAGVCSGTAATMAARQRRRHLQARRRRRQHGRGGGTAARHSRGGTSRRSTAWRQHLHRLFLACAFSAQKKDFVFQSAGLMTGGLVPLHLFRHAFWSTT